MAILKIKDAEGNVQEILAIKGEDGKDGKDGINGSDYVMTDADKQEIATKVVEKLSTETWTFTLEDGTTVNKSVVLG
jgi:hypothetical protein